MEVEQPVHLKDEEFSVKLTGQACVPEVTIVEPPNGKRGRAALNFGRTLVNDSDAKSFAFRNIGVISAKVIVEIYEDPKFSFALVTHDIEEDLTKGRDFRFEWSQYLSVSHETIATKISKMARSLSRDTFFWNLRKCYVKKTF